MDENLDKIIEEIDQKIKEMEEVDRAMWESVDARKKEENKNQSVDKNIEENE